MFAKRWWAPWNIPICIVVFCKKRTPNLILSCFHVLHSHRTALQFEHTAWLNHLYIQAAFNGMQFVIFCVCLQKGPASASYYYHVLFQSQLCKMFFMKSLCDLVICRWGSNTTSIFNTTAECGKITIGALYSPILHCLSCKIYRRCSTLETSFSHALSSSGMVSIGLFSITIYMTNL